MRKIIVMDARTIVIGRAGENAAAQVVWPGILAKWRGLYGEGTVQLAARRPGDKEPYPAVCETDGDDVTWVVSAGDTGRAGIGECELSYLVGDTVAKSQTWATMVMKSLTGDGTAEPPEEPAKAWFTAIQSQIGDLADLTTKAKENLVAAINEAAKTGSGSAGSISMRTADGYIQYSTDGGTSWENLIALADLKGEPGQDGAPGEDGKPGADGYSPTAKVEETADGAKITITDKAGTTEATVKNGITPTIGDNGNWYLGTTDTGKPSRGPAGQDGKDGAPGKDGADGAPGKDGAGMDVTGATPGQIAKITAVDDNGKPTAWEPVDMPSGGGGSGGSFSNDLLAEGTISAGTSAWTVASTGLTMGDLRKYKSFVILITGTITGKLYYDFGANIGQVKAAVRFIWEDDQKTILRCDGYSEYTDTFSNNYIGNIEYWGADCPWIRFDFRNVADTIPVNFANQAETTAEVAYKIMGWMQ